MIYIRRFNESSDNNTDNIYDIFDINLEDCEFDIIEIEPRRFDHIKGVVVSIKFRLSDDLTNRLISLDSAFLKSLSVPINNNAGISDISEFKDGVKGKLKVIIDRICRKYSFVMMDFVMPELKPNSVTISFTILD